MTEVAEEKTLEERTLDLELYVGALLASVSDVAFLVNKMVSDTPLSAEERANLIMIRDALCQWHRALGEEVQFRQSTKLGLEAALATGRIN